jgi:hypothetical protein
VDLKSLCLIAATFLVYARICVAQTPSHINLAAAAPSVFDPALSSSSKLPDAPSLSSDLPDGLPPADPEPFIKATRVSPTVNGRPYVRPTPKEQFSDYVKNTYGLPALAFTSVRSTIAQGRGKPNGWAQDWPGFGQRFGSAAATTVIDGNVRYGMEMLFREDMRYIPCHGCSVKRKIENALLAEITARHDSDGHRFFTLTPTVSDMVGPIVANSVWVPGHTAIDGFIGSRLVFATRIGGHMFSEFVSERRHRDPKLPN